MKITGKAGLTTLAVVIALGAATGAFARGEGKGARFEALDADADGFITEVEFNAAMNDRFTKMDADGNGTVTQAEFVAMIAERAANSDRDVSAEKIEKRATKMMERIDADGDGAIQKAEFGKKGFTELLERFDADADGQLSKEEMASGKGKRKGADKDQG
ncbi:MAG: hypothetical protein AAF826_08825 [Pseudomonadota bacterium]